MPPEDYYENMDNTFDKGQYDTYTSTTLRELEKNYVIPKGTKNIETVDEIEVIGGVTIIYTKSGKSYAEHQVEDVGVVYNYVTEKK
jgi:hypothetical protein